MPPRKRARTAAATRGTRNRTTTPAESTQATSEAEADDNDPSPSTQKIAQPTSPVINILQDPWTDDEETQLFKSIIQYKPTGIAANFHMLSIAESLRSHGYANGEHTNTKGIWNKLGSLYDLEALNEREDRDAGWADDSDEDGDEEDEDEAEEDEDEDISVPFEEGIERVAEAFTSGDDRRCKTTLGEMMWARRFTTTRSRDEFLDELKTRSNDDVAMTDFNEAPDKSLMSSPEPIDGLHETRSGLGLELPSREAADAAYAAMEEEVEKTSKKGGRPRKSASSTAGAKKGRTRATRATPVQEETDAEEEEDEVEGSAEEDEEDGTGDEEAGDDGEGEEGNDEEEEAEEKSTAESPPTRRAATRGRGRGRGRKR